MASSRPLGLTAIALVVFFLVNTDTTFVTCQESTLQEQSQDGASNNERYVSASRGSSDVEGCGSWSDPCGTLAAAAAAASSSRSSLSIILLPGAHDLTTAVEFVNATVSISGPGGWPSTQLVCTQGSHRGLAFLAGSSAQLSGLEVTGCSSGRGAGILVEASNITLSGVRLSNNTAMGAGSVGGGLALLDGSVATASDCEVEGNFAAKYGAGAYVHGSLLEVTGGRVKANRLTGAGRGAGVVAFAGSTVRLAGDASVEHNEGYFGGGVMAQASHLFMEGGSSVQNNAAMYGGGLVLVAALGSVSGAELRGNEAAHFGGAALLESSVLRFRGGTCSGNSATLGGCYYCSNSTIEVEGSALDYNVAGGSGGVGGYVDCNPTAAQPCSSSLEIRGSSLRNNTAAEEGGALALRSVAVSLVKTELSGGGAARGGALACSGESSVSLHGSVASSNAAEEEGGAAFVGDGCVLTATGTEISGNEAQVRGGGAFVSGGGSLEADRASFRGNAAREGGAIFASGGAAFVAARDSNFTRNEAEESGGGVSVRGSPFEAQGSAFARNKANRGAAIAVVSDLAAHPVLLSGLRFEENIATDGSSA